MSVALVIPDVHQNIAWVKNILEKENPDKFDKIIFLGDFFDSSSDKKSTVVETSEYLNHLRDTLKD